VRRSRTRLAASVVVVLLAASGCGAVIPDSSDVQRARAGSNAQEPQPNSYIPRDPTPGAGPRQIVDGFLDAMNAYPRTLGLPRKFLTPAAGTAWQPSSAVAVYRSRRTGQPATGLSKEPVSRTVTMVANPIGSLDSRGSWVTHEYEYRHTFVLVRFGGQWRISNPPSILLVDTEYFARYYSSASLYFFGSKRKSLVPDPVFVLRGSSMASDLVRALMMGPSQHLRSVVTTTLEQSADVSVKLRAGVATVSLPAAARTWSAGDPELIAVQLVWTLRQVQDISGVRILAGGEPLSIPSAQPVIRTDTYSAYGPVGIPIGQTLDGLVGGHIVSIGTSSPGRVPGPIGQLDGAVNSFASNIASAELAAVTNNGTRLAVGGISRGSPDVGTWLRGTDLTSPSWDRWGYVWVIDHLGDRSRIVVATATRARTVAAPELAGADVRQIRISRDGARIAALIGTGSRAQLVIGQVVRDELARPVRVQGIGPIKHAGDPAGSPISFDWYTPTALVVVSSTAQGKSAPVIASIDGATLEPLPAFQGAAIKQVAAGSDPSVPVVALDAEGSVYALGAAERWEHLAAAGKVTAIRYPG
jgi:Lipoprotein LpqB beta-propeller domain/Sporulation and spore germination